LIVVQGILEFRSHSTPLSCSCSSSCSSSWFALAPAALAAAANNLPLTVLNGYFCVGNWNLKELFSNASRTGIYPSVFRCALPIWALRVHLACNHFASPPLSPCCIEMFH
jgi:hypothetical protein